jgi:long-subunit fatty acid transport protein
MGLRHREIIFIICLFFLLVTGAANAQQIEISSSLNPVGSGARAMGMGGAFIGVADDATAASWNPAGLVQLEKPEISFVYSYFSREQTYDSSTHSEIEGRNRMASDGLNYASAAFPFILFKRNMIISVNYQRLYELKKELNFPLTRDVAGDILTEDIEFTQDGHLYAVSPAFAMQITPMFYLGATLNFWDNISGENGWDTIYESNTRGVLAGNSVELRVSQKDEVDFEGVNANFGFMWISDPFTLGGVIKTPFNADLTRKTSLFQSQDWPAFPLHTESLSEDRQEFTMKMPLSYGLGLSYRYSDEWTMSFDVYRTDWSKFEIRDEGGNRLNPLDGKPLSEGRLKDTTQVRAGVEYFILGEHDMVPLRLGLFYDPEPAKGSVDDYYGFSLGTGYKRGRVAIDAAYQYRKGSNVTGDIPAIDDINADIDQHYFLISGIFYL